MQSTFHELSFMNSKYQDDSRSMISMNTEHKLSNLNEISPNLILPKDAVLRLDNYGKQLEAKFKQICNAGKNSNKII